VNQAIESIYNAVADLSDDIGVSIEEAKKTKFVRGQPTEAGALYTVSLVKYIGHHMVFACGCNEKPLVAAREAADEFRIRLALAEARASRLPVKAEVVHA
jgi:hypothetical protein